MMMEEEKKKASQLIFMPQSLPWYQNQRCYKNRALFPHEQKFFTKYKQIKSKDE